MSIDDTTNKTGFALSGGARFGLGAFFGGLLGATYSFFTPTLLWAIVASGAAAMVVGTLSLKFGDRFWDGLSRFGYWM